MKIEIKAPRDQVWRHVKELPARVRYVRRLVPWMAAQHLKQQIEDRLPGEKGAVALKRSLRVAAVSGMDAGVFAYSIFSDPKDSNVNELDPAETLIYVKVRALAVLIPESVRVLEEFGPWTTSTLPFMPDKRHALILSRRVPARLVTQTDEDRRKDKIFWEVKLRRAGVRNQLQISKPSKSHVIPDSAFLSLRYEFGLGGMASKPHWRPGILGFIRMLPGMFSKKRLRGLVTDPTNMQWGRSKLPVDATIPTSTLKDFVPFQNKLGIKVSA